MASGIEKLTSALNATIADRQSSHINLLSLILTGV